MHILYICHEYPPSVAGGIGTAVAVLARGMVRRGHRVSVLGLYNGPLRIENDEGVVVHRLPAPRVHKAVYWLLSRWQIRTAIRKMSAGTPVDIIEWPDWDGQYLLGIRGVTDVLKVHGGRVSHRVHGVGPKMPIREFFEVRMMRKMSNWIGVSQWFKEEWKSYSRSRPRRECVVYNPVDVEAFKPAASRDPNMIFYSGGLRRRKGVHTLARASATFLKDLPDARLVMATFESDLTKKEVLALAGAGASRIEFLPFMAQAELAKRLAQAAVFVMPSLYESCGNGWVEAMACGIPVIGSLSSCGPEVVKQGETGLLCDPESPNDVADKVKLIMRERGLAAELGRAGRREAIERFSVEKAAAASEHFYGLCLPKSMFSGGRQPVANMPPSAIVGRY
jgi:glycosyltransferase involved in cell wall biosynthesis